jgi:hypothetical protein
MARSRMRWFAALGGCQARDRMREGDRCLSGASLFRPGFLTWLTACVATGVLASAAIAAPIPIEPADLDGIESKRPVIDTLLESPPGRARAAAALRTEQWYDDQGRTITISTDHPHAPKWAKFTS